MESAIEMILKSATTNEEKINIITKIIENNAAKIVENNEKELSEEEIIERDEDAFAAELNKICVDNNLSFWQLRIFLYGSNNYAMYESIRKLIQDQTAIEIKKCINENKKLIFNSKRRLVARYCGENKPDIQFIFEKNHYSYNYNNEIYTFYFDCEEHRIPINIENKFTVAFIKSSNNSQSSSKEICMSIKKLLKEVEEAAGLSSSSY